MNYELRTNENYGDFPTLEEIQKDFLNFLTAVMPLHTEKDAKRVSDKSQMKVQANGFPLEQYLAESHTEKDLSFLQFDVFGCLRDIVVDVNKSVLDIQFNVWSNLANDIFVKRYTYLELTDVKYRVLVSQARRDMNHSTDIWYKEVWTIDDILDAARKEDIILSDEQIEQVKEEARKAFSDLSVRDELLDSIIRTVAKDTKKVTLPSGQHICQYCGELTDGENEDLLCPACRELFGHTMYSGL